MKRLRKEFTQKVRFYHCGEYGENYGRPHYHFILFNVGFNDRVHFKTVNGNRLYISDTLNRLWPLGHSLIGDVTFESAAYCARYVVKKIHGRESTYTRIRERPDGKGYMPIKSEYSTMSRRSGIGKDWYDKFKDDVYPHDYVVARGKQQRPPRAFDRYLELDDPELLASLKEERKKNAARFEDNNTSRRLRDREIVKRAQITNLRRSHDDH